MPAKSKAQQRAAGAALGALRKGSTAGLKGPAKSMAKMGASKLRHYAQRRKK